MQNAKMPSVHGRRRDGEQDALPPPRILPRRTRYNPILRNATIILAPQ
jgi:hypothetical protein